MTHRHPKNIFWHDSLLTPQERQDWLGMRGATLWFTGLPASGKSTLAVVLERVLVLQGKHAVRLDGDNIRYGLSCDLGFSREDRRENIRRVAEMAKILADGCCIALVSFISPFMDDREQARLLHLRNEIPFFEIFADAPVEVCERRDTKGLYHLAREGQLAHLTGVDDPYQRPNTPDVHLDTEHMDIEQCARLCLEPLIRNGFARPGECDAAIAALKGDDMLS